MTLSIVYHKDVIEFVTVAKEYIALIDFPEGTKKKAFFFKSHKILPLLYLKASLLPEIPDVYNTGNERFCTEEMYFGIQYKIHRLLRTNDYEVLVNYDSQNLDEQEWIKLSEIFTDIFQSLYDFLNLYRLGTEEMMNDALFECQNDFKTLWGKKSLQLIEALHRLLYENLIIEDDKVSENEDDTPLNTDSWFTEKIKGNHEHDDHE